MKYDVPARVRENAATPIRDLDRYRETAAHAVADPDGFWLGVTQERVAWGKAPTVGLRGSYDDIKDGPLSWFADGELNVTVSCLDRHLESRGDKVAILWEGDEPGDVRTLTYRELHAEVCKAANALTALGLKNGERAIIYMGMVPEAAIAMLACARIGAIHSVVFGGFSARRRFGIASATVAPRSSSPRTSGMRGGKHIPLKADDRRGPARGRSSVKHVLVYKRTEEEVRGTRARRLVARRRRQGERGATRRRCPRGRAPPLHPLHLGLDRAPQGRGAHHRRLHHLRELHARDGLRPSRGRRLRVRRRRRLDHRAQLHRLRPARERRDDAHVRVGADLSRRGPLLGHGRAARHHDLLHRADRDPRARGARATSTSRSHERSTLRVLGTVGEPINPEAWEWYYDVVGEKPLQHRRHLVADGDRRDHDHPDRARRRRPSRGRRRCRCRGSSPRSARRRAT